MFAPTDEAFAKLPAGTLEELLKPENRARLRGILLYHVTPGSFDSEAVLRHGRLRTLQGGRLTATVTDTVRINDAKVVLANVFASNGIIHVIDSVLLPPARQALRDRRRAFSPPGATGRGQRPVFLLACDGAPPAGYGSCKVA